MGEHVFLYCERGTSEALLAEPFNAASNLGFLLAALAGLLLLLRRPASERGADQFLLVALVLLIGLGSLAFHLFATRAAQLADVIPIDVFMLVYLGFALNRFVGVPPGWTVLILIGFTGIVAMTMQLKCWEGAIGFPGADVARASACLNGSLVYLPALFAMIVIGAILLERGHRAAPYILSAAVVFAVSIRLALTRSCALRCLYNWRPQGGHAFRLAPAQCTRPVPAAQGEPRRGRGGSEAIGDATLRGAPSLGLLGLATTFANG